MLGKINIRRTLILLGVFSIGIFIGHKLTLNTSGNTLGKVTPTLDKAIDKNTIENNINNDFSIGKIKNSDSLIIKFDPTNNQKPINLIVDCIPIPELLKALRPSDIKRLKKKGVID